MATKFTIEIEEIELNTNDVYNLHASHTDGIYLVNDGIAWLLVCVNGNNTLTMPLPSKDMVKQLIAKNEDKVQRDYTKEAIAKFDRILGLLDKPSKSTSSIDTDAIAKLVAVTQKPELIKDL